MIYITGDTHTDQEKLINILTKITNTTSEHSILLICGDFGFIFLYNEEERLFLKYLESFTTISICFCDGNHENFPALYAFPIVQWNGGQTHQLSKNVYHLMRGEIFTIENKSFFVMGGAASTDVNHRLILEKQDGITRWWPEEIPTIEEIEHGIDSLNKRNNEVDYVLSHTTGYKTIDFMCFLPLVQEEHLTKFLDLNDVTFKKHFFGHFHIDRFIDDKRIAVYNKILCLETLSYI